MKGLARNLANKLCADLNSLEHGPIGFIERDIVEPHPTSQALMVVGRKTQLDYASHPLVVGAPYRPEDIEISALLESDTESSGVCGTNVVSFICFAGPIALVARILCARCYSCWHQ